ncbi:hypothetical protein [Microcystis phage Me-ZS1]|nr:hypothetical protein [Microcystis phage Me-ZS1]
MTTIIDLLNNPETREMVEALEDTITSCRGKQWKDTVLNDVLDAQHAELKMKTGYDYIVDRSF